MPRTEKLSISGDCMRDVLVEMTESLSAKLTQMNEKILLSVTEKLNECFNKSMELMTQTFQNMMMQVTKSLAECFQNALAPIIQKIDSMGTKTEPKENTSSDTSEAVKIATKTLLDFEREKEEMKRRAHNIIVSGLPSSPNVMDVDLFGNFCGNNLTVKPLVVAVRRLGRDNKNPNAKLCVTLENVETVKDVISSSRLLRASQDSEVRRVYFNHDLTRLQSEEAYARRLAKHSSRTQKDTTTTQPFP